MNSMIRMMLIGRLAGYRDLPAERSGLTRLRLTRLYFFSVRMIISLIIWLLIYFTRITRWGSIRHGRETMRY